jgi:enterochelin esterase family protein
MKQKLSSLAVMLFLSVSIAFPQWGGGPKTPNDTLKSVRVLPGGKIILSIYAPEAKSVTVGGELIPWGTKVEGVKSESGVWTFPISNVKAGTYRYNFVVDNVKVYDPKAANAFETSALLDVMPDGENEFFALRNNIPHGAMAELYYYSKTTKSIRRMHVWTPPGYNARNNKLPVFYLIHGGGDSDLAWPNVGRAGYIMDNLLSEGKCKEMIVVMPDGGMDPKLFAKDFVNDLIPYIQSNYNVFANAENRALAGLSMGGLEVTESFMANPDMFAYINVMSSGWFSNDKEMYESGDKRLSEIASTLNKTIKYLIFTMGGPEDIAYKNGKEMLKIFDKNGIKYKYSEMSGGHSWLVWRQDLKTFASELFK